MVSALRSHLSCSTKCRTLQRREHRENAIRVAVDTRQLQISTAWPSVVSEDIVFDCLNNYRRATVWVPPAVCCVCGLERVDVTDVVVDNGAQSSLDFSNLFVKDPHNIADLTGFQYGLPAIDGTVFDTSAMTISETSRVVLKVCVECLSALKRNRVPRLSLDNYLYRGKLPSELQDLTWVEEMVCAKC